MGCLDGMRLSRVGGETIELYDCLFIYFLVVGEICC